MLRHPIASDSRWRRNNGEPSNDDASDVVFMPFLLNRRASRARLHFALLDSAIQLELPARVATFQYADRMHAGASYARPCSLRR